MQAEKMTVTIQTIGTTKLDTALEESILIPLPDKQTIADWTKLFNAWPKKDGVMESVTMPDAIIAGLRTLARAQKQKAMIADYRAANGGGKRGKASTKEIVTL